MRRQPHLFFRTIWSFIVDDFRRKPVNRVSTPLAPPPPRSQPVQPVQPTPQPVAQVTPQPNPVAPEPVTPQPITNDSGILNPSKKKKSRKKLVLGLAASLFGAILLTFAGLFFWYNAQLAPVDATNTDKKVVTIVAGSTPDVIASQLKEEGLIRDSAVFLWHARFEGVQNSLQAGTYRLSPSESTPEITTHLTSGKVDSFNIRFLPGATLADNRKIFISAGYSEAEVDVALAKTYESPLFEGKPADADLEGYIYGETYSFAVNTSVESILERVFTEYYTVVKDNNLVELYKAQGLSLYEGITLASIVQREASPGGDDMPQIAQVFYLRLAQGMPLGSDVTYQYIADKTGVERDTNLDSPYNTRRYAGLPPGPISAPGKKALMAVASPAEGDYLYFLSGDDHVTYYGRTLQEHEANIKNHCQEKCKII